MCERFECFTCLTCPDQPEFTDREDLYRHITEKHGFIPGTHFTKHLKVYLDYWPDWESHIEWDYGSFKLYEVTGVKYNAKQEE